MNTYLKGENKMKHEIVPYGIYTREYFTRGKPNTIEISFTCKYGTVESVLEEFARTIEKLYIKALEKAMILKCCGQITNEVKYPYICNYGYFCNPVFVIPNKRLKHVAETFFYQLYGSHPKNKYTLYVLNSIMVRRIYNIGVRTGIIMAAMLRSIL